MLVTALLATYAHAQTYETPWGTISQLQRDMVCAADHVFVGRINTVSSFVPTDGFFPDRINSVVEFEVERDVRASGATFAIQLPGGEIEGVRHLVEGYPIPLVGRRYLMVVDRWPIDRPPASQGDLRYFFSVALDSELPLPDVAELRAALNTICGSSGGSR